MAENSIILKNVRINVDHDDAPLRWDFNDIAAQSDLESKSIIRGLFTSYDLDSSGLLSNTELLQMKADAVDFGDDPDFIKALEPFEKSGVYYTDFEQALPVIRKLLEKSSTDLSVKQSLETLVVKWKAAGYRVRRWISAAGEWDINAMGITIAIFMQGYLIALYTGSFPLFLLILGFGVLAALHYLSDGIVVLLKRFLEASLRLSQPNSAEKRVKQASMTISNMVMKWVLVFLCAGIAMQNYKDDGEQFQAEILLPIVTQAACMIGLSVMTLWVVSESSKLCQRRDERMLRNVPVISSTLAGSVTAFTLFRIILKRADIIYFSDNMPSRKKTVLKAIPHLIGATLVGVLSLLAQRYSSILQPLIKPSLMMKQLTGESPLPEADTYGSFIFFVFVYAFTTFVSTVDFENTVTWKTLAPFAKTYEMMRLLLSVTNGADAALGNVPYCSLYNKGNIYAFHRIHDYMSRHHLGSILGEASTGFASMLTIDVFLIAALVIMVFIPGSSVRVMILLGYYILFVTVWCFVLLYQAVKINSIHDDLLSRVQAIRADIKLGHVLSDDRDETTEQLEFLSDAMEHQFQPVTVLGIPATPTLMNVFILYLVSSAGAIAWSKLSGS